MPSRSSWVVLAVAVRTATSLAWTGGATSHSPQSGTRGERRSDRPRLAQSVQATSLFESCPPRAGGGECSKSFWTLCAVIVMTALVLVPGSLSASDSAARAGERRRCARFRARLCRRASRPTSASRAPTSPTSSSRASSRAAQRGHARQPEPALPGPRGLRWPRDRQRRRRRRVVFAAGARAPCAPRAGRGRSTRADAVEAAADGLDLDGARRPARPRARDARRRSSRAAASRTRRSRPARLAADRADGLRLAWQVTIDDSSDAHLWNAAVDAETGELLDADDWTIARRASRTWRRRSAVGRRPARPRVPAYSFSPTP